MSDLQRTLVDVPATPRLTDRQRNALEILTAAGPEGVTPASLGAHIHCVWSGKHFVNERCDFCKSTGLELLRALRKKGVARQRRVDGRTFWQATDLPDARPRGMSENIGF